MASISATRNEKGPSRRAAIRSAIGLLVLSVLLGTPLSSSAHHGTSVTYDITKTVTLTGTVTEWDFIFPHPALYFDVTNAAGKVEHWGSEVGANPAYYMKDKRGGVNRNSIKPGDKLKITCYPHRTPSAKACLAKEVEVNGKLVPGLTFKPPVPQKPAASPPATSQ